MVMSWKESDFQVYLGLLDIGDKSNSSVGGEFRFVDTPEIS